jgi:hypothetical protein
VTYAQWGDAVHALQWLASAERIAPVEMAQLKVDPLLDPIRNDEQFKVLLARMKVPP